ncbi:uncharacterized protein LOC143295759 [Babylonia areolata]|uniref:uncharacterized protein LOC143295759 n=1 Tax=Babylonia areolata TaxID=304850 RepID=UPI003FCFCAA5
MVHKTSHRGVHSGNTLRAFNSRFSRRYHHQSCIVSRVRPELLQKLAGGSGKPDDKKLELHNIAVDVPLSLNKQSRWSLPSALIRQIKSNDIAQAELTVSLLERHKLKQHANCVSFHSNKGEVKRIQPRNGRYFGYSYPTIDGKSRRAWRREQRELRLKEQMKGKTIEVYTEQGAAKKNMNLGETEVRYEVYYPSPAKSSISHNPRYIKQDVDVAPGDDNEYVQHGKPKKQHRGKQRKRMSVKDLDVCDLPSYHEQCNHSLTTVPDQEEFAPVEGISAVQSTTVCLLTTLIEKAQQLQNFKGITNSRHRKKTNKTSTSHHEDDKSHIVFLSDHETHTSPDENAVQSSSSISLVSFCPSESTRVMLPKEDVSLTSLKECFGQGYFEASCKPRKFVLDVTQNVQEVLKKKGMQIKTVEKYSDTYLICIHDGFYDDLYDVYKVLLNSRLHQGLLPVQINTEENQDLFRGTLMNLISQTMDFVEESLVRKLEDKTSVPVVSESISVKASARQLNSHLGSAMVYVPSVQHLFQKGSDVSDFAMPTLFDLLQEDPLFCDVCYEDISPLTQDSAASTSLLKCGHRVCDSCWSQHIHMRFHEGFVRLTCPGYNCQEEVKVGVLLSLAPLDNVEKLLQRQEEVRIGGSLTEKWCPNESCGRVISINTSSTSGKHQQDVVCACGMHVCFQCLLPAHWPASCKQAEDYRASLATAVFPDRLAEVHDDYKTDREAQLRKLQEKKTMLVEGKHCPKCGNFVCKNGGCPQMTCRCGQMFCWYCAKPGLSHPSRHGCVTEEKEKMLSTTVIVRHLEANQNSKDQKEEKHSGNRRQRVSLLERAVEHRKHHENKQQNVRAVTILAKAVASAAAKNNILTQHVIKACTEAFPSSSSKPSAKSPASESTIQAHASVLEIVTTFLRSAAQSKQELHEVVEYSLVLLKDLPDSLLRQRALRVTEDLGAFCSFSQSVFDAWSSSTCSHGQPQEAVIRLAEIHRWIQSALDIHIVTVRKLRSLGSPQL